MKTYQLVGEIADFDYVSETFGFRICGPASLKKFLADCADGEKVEIEINSPGGLCVPGMEMANAIKNSKAHVIAHVTGMAASMASVIACACSEIKMEEAAFLMIHDPWSYAEGNAAAMRKEAQNLDQFKAVIMSFYRGKFNRTAEEISALMSDETWMTGAECVENGLVCELIKSDLRMAALVGSAKFGKMPEAAAALYKFQELTEDAKAELEKAKAEQTAVAGDDNFEARFKGASKKINELQDALADARANVKTGLDALKAKDSEIAKLEDELCELKKTDGENVQKIVDLQATIDDLNGKLEQSEKDLKDAKASVSTLTTELEQVKTDLAKIGEHAKHLEETRAVITGNVLIPTEAGGSYDAKMDAAIKSGTVNDRMKLREQKKSGKIK